MDRVKLSENEKSTWIALNDYLIGLLKPKENIAAIPKGEKHQIIGEITCYGTETIRNKYSDANPTFLKDNFAAYCNYFIERHADQPIKKNGDNYQLFETWSKQICSRMKWADLSEIINLGIIMPAGREEKTFNIKVDNTFSSIEKIFRLFTSEENIKNYRLLWPLLSQDSKIKMCNGSFSEFSKLNFMPFRNVFFCNHKYLNNESIVCDIFMEIKVITLPSYCCYLHEIRRRDDQLELFHSHMNQMLEMFHFDGIGNDVSKKELAIAHVCENDLCYDIENIFDVLGITSANIYTILPLTKTAYYKSFGQVYFAKENEQWVIGKTTMHDFLEVMGLDYPLTWIPIKRSHLK